MSGIGKRNIAVQYAGGNTGVDNNNNGGETGKTAIVCCNGGANLRQGPGLNYQVITPVGKGTTVSIVGQQADWCKVTIPDGRSGYMYIKALQMQ
ncbi:MAG: SH3 domain-containing protein [Candidatus Wallbacteria bacterium]|nr:SH3 domain-containing protein [Candidatus Wallbacteria bacterium]